MSTQNTGSLVELVILVYPFSGKLEAITANTTAALTSRVHGAPSSLHFLWHQCMLVSLFLWVCRTCPMSTVWPAVVNESPSLL